MYSLIIRKAAQLVAVIKRVSVVKLNLLVLLIMLLGANAYLPGREADAVPGLYSDLLALLLKVLTLAVLLVVVLGFVTSFGAYWRYRRRAAGPPDVRFAYPRRERGAEVIVELACRAFCPPGGSVKVALEYDKGFMTPKLALWNGRRGLLGFLRGSDLEGRFALRLPEARHYELRAVVVSFEDAFNLFAFSRRHAVRGRFTVLPAAERVDAPDAVPVQPRDAVERTDSPRPQEGEWLHFKGFEPSDDTRRIVWQVYARSKELVIRQQEAQNVYASRIDLFASFHSALPWQRGDNPFAPLFLSVYKRKIWGLVRALEERSDGIAVRYVPDQLVGAEPHDALPAALVQLAAMGWHSDIKPGDHLELPHVSVCCISSLSPADDLERVLRRLPPAGIVVFVPLSEIFRLRDWAGIPADIFMEPAAGDIGRLRWWLSPMRYRLLRNERAIRRMFADFPERFYEV